MENTLWIFFVTIAVVYTATIDRRVKAIERQLLEMSNRK